jgi:type I restriction-modification system DNA methylase subunit
MPDTNLLTQIQAYLEAPDLRESLPRLFRETLLWGRASGEAFSRELTFNGETHAIGLAPIAQLGGLPVLRVDWFAEKLPNVAQRRAVQKSLAATFAEHLLVYVTPSGTQAAFVWARVRGEKKVELRTLPFGAGAPARTTLEQLASLAFTVNELGLFGDVSPSQVIDRLNSAFDVEKVTRQFFKKYREIFEQAEASIRNDWSAEQKRLYTQKFFNRLMFLAFLERKGWLTFNDRRDYLRALFEDYWRNDPDKRREANFHRKRLNTLFFMGLNFPDGDKRNEAAYKPILSLIGDVPYLNGGLFEQEADDETVFFPDEVVALILKDLLYAFNFTVTESTPLDVEVAVDPEMLGKIFEELVTGRHESGSYYTPKPVVAFMCREALKGYLGGATGESEAALAKFVDENDPADLRNPERILDALRQARVCDPACGSGAYLLGMLHELLEQRNVLFASRGLDARTVYERKLEIIQNSLYGVDLDPFAVNIARLRLWLSLIVDYEGETPPPLPNLDFKIEAGDSLTAPDPSDGLQPDLFSSLVNEFLQAKNQYGRAHNTEKTALRERVENLRGQIKTWAGRSADFAGFDWVIEFAEIFVPGERAIGFDMILANPPYVRADAQFKHIEDEQERQAEIARWQAFRAQLKKSKDKLYETLHEKWDLYIPFLERAHQLLADSGQMIFIIPDAYNAAKYAEKSHEFFLKRSRVMRIDFCSEMDLFDAGVNNTILHFEKGAPADEHQPVRVRRWGKREEFDDNLETLPTFQQSEFWESLFRSGGTKNESSAGLVTLDKICYVSVGMAIHADEKKAQGLFIAEDLVSDLKDEKHPKPYVEGKDIKKWGFQRTRYLEYGTERAPAMFRRPTFIELHEPFEKLMAFRMCGENISVTYDDKQYMSNHTVILCVPWHFLKNVTNKSIKKAAEYKHQNPEGDRESREKLSAEFSLKYLLAIMNSSFAKQFLKKIRQSKIDIYPDEWKRLPIAPIALEAQQPFVEKVDAILGEFKQHGYPLPPEAAGRVKALEDELDEMVARLYA